MITDMDNNIVIEIFEKGEFKIEFKKSKTVSGKYLYGGFVYYKDSFIMFIPYSDKKILTRKYIQNLVNTHEIHSHGISVGTKDNNRIMYYYFSPYQIY
jgi:hypothetical protein